MKIHLVYAFDPHNGELRAPHSITRNLYKYLSERAEVVYYQWDSMSVADVGPDDIFIGHPHYDKNTIVQRTFREKKCRMMCTIHPLHTALPEHNMPFDWIAQKADKIFSICGPYWTDTIASTPFASWAPKIVRLDMAVDPEHFPFLKTKFNPIGKRRLLYIGSTMPMKNVGYLAEIMRWMPDVELHWYGGSGDHPLAKLPNVKTIGWVQLDRNMAQTITNNCDLFVNVSNSDANPTTLLEAMAWGLPVACTKESGYWRDPLFGQLELHDINQTITTIKNILEMPEYALSHRSKEGRKAIETHYTWDRFCSTVWNAIQSS